MRPSGMIAPQHTQRFSIMPTLFMLLSSHISPPDRQWRSLQNLYSQIDNAYYANAIHLICDPLAQHLEEPLARSLKELAVILSATQVVAVVAVVSPAALPLELMHWAADLLVRTPGTRPDAKLTAYPHTML